MKRTRLILWGIIFLTALCLRIGIPKTPIQIQPGPIKIDTAIGGPISLWGKFRRDLEIKKGLDIRGGIHVVMKAEMGDIPEERRGDALSSAKEVVERRVNLFGVAEPNIQTSKSGGDFRVIVELPGVTDTKKALELIGETAQLDFREPVYVEGTKGTEGTEGSEEGEEPASEEQLVGFQKTDLTGKNLTQARVDFNQQTGEPVVAIEFDSEGAKKFEELTKRFVGKPLAIYLDELPISAPRVQEVISEGKAIISGQFTLDQAKKLTIQLNAGALPVPLEIIEQRQIGAILGQESVRKSIVAGIIGLILVAIFMVAYYGKLGVLADLALLEYGLITLALYKLIPVTLTMAGLTGFILSVGMAVDSNILIFERIREEVRRGVPKKAAMERGFVKALDAIKDANICTLITCFLLFNPFGWSFLNTSGMVRGFALTLALGVLVSLFTGVVVTRTLVRVFYR